MSATHELLAECHAIGIELLVAGDDRLIIDAPQDALTPDLLGRLQAHKGELLALLKSSTEPEWSEAAATETASALAKPVCRCGSMAWRDVPIHGGESIRRDCERCQRFIDFSVWYGKTTLHNEQYSIG
jgi:hypothetical protein